LTFEPVEFSPPQPQRVELENGIILYLLQDHELPIVEAQVFIRAGSDFDPPDKVGLSSLTAHVMRTGGTKFMSGDEVDEQLEFLAASASVSGFSTLSEHLDEVLRIFSHILMYPVFEVEKLELAQQRMLEMIRRESDRPTQVAIREFIKHVAEEHPFSWFPTEQTVLNISREDLISFHKRFYHPNNLILAIAGDFEKETLIKKIEKAFEEWNPTKIDYPDVPSLKKESKRVIYYAPKQIGQSTIILGHPVMPRSDPDFIPFALMNRILGGSPAGDDRLFREIRERHGLAYAVGSFLTGGNRYRGIFGVYSITRSDATGKVIKMLLNELKRMRDEMVSEEELDKTKNAIVNQFVFQYTSTLEIASQAAFLEFYELPADYYKTYLDQIKKISREDILQVVTQHLHPDNMKIIVVGSQELFDLPLETFGRVEVIDLG
ncbi:insulinase family protein, partial [Candidatus Aerophobetes bacterium]|nr:insulinase family protein [Candidatus Aerophobetes bacterium]